jgi:hypothetical protein
MPGLWRNQDGTREGKYLVLRRDGTVPEWPAFVLGARDPAAPGALRAYASACRVIGMDIAYVEDIARLADEFEEYRRALGPGDAAAPKHRTDDPVVIALMTGEIERLDRAEGRR